MLEVAVLVYFPDVEVGVIVQVGNGVNGERVGGGGRGWKVFGEFIWASRALDDIVSQKIRVILVVSR